MGADKQVVGDLKACGGVVALARDGGAYDLYQARFVRYSSVGRDQALRHELHFVTNILLNTERLGTGMNRG